MFISYRQAIINFDQIQEEYSVEDWSFAAINGEWTEEFKGSVKLLDSNGQDTPGKNSNFWAKANGWTIYRARGRNNINITKESSNGFWPSDATMSGNWIYICNINKKIFSD